MNILSNHVCPAEIASILDNRIRRRIQNPEKILGPYVKEGMTVLDMGCGPGYFSIALAKMVGSSGMVIAADLQEGMLSRVKKKVKGTELEDRIMLHKCESDRIGLSEKVDLAISLYMLHEVPNQEKTLNEIASILKPNGRLLIAEPYIHVSKKAFERTLRIAQNIGFTVVEKPDIFFSRAVLFKKS